MIAATAVAEGAGDLLPYLMSVPPTKPVPPADTNVDTPPIESPPTAGEAKAIRELLDLLPADVLADINGGAIDLNDPAFLDGLVDHVSRLSVADPRQGQRILGKIIKLKKQIRRTLRDSDPAAVTSQTVVRSAERVGRNDRCPCGSGRKFKQCCLRKGAGER